MIITGIDYSLRGPAICVHKGELNEPFRFCACKFYFLTDTKKYAQTFLSNIHGSKFDEYNHDCQRYDSISSWASDVCHGSDQVAIEGYAYGAKGRVFHAFSTPISHNKRTRWGLQRPVSPIIKGDRRPR